MNAREILDKAIEQNKSNVCVGLDIDLNKLPKHLADNENGWWEFNKSIIDATKDQVCAYKPNSAFYETLGESGMRLLKKTIEYIRTETQVLCILDAKRGDIGNTSDRYASAAFDYFGADALTVNPYMGMDSLEPFFNYRSKLNFVLCLTSNPGASDFQFDGTDYPLFLHIADAADHWNETYGNVGLVAGATRAEHIASIRELAPTLPMLIPGVGQQGGQLAEAVDAAGKKGPMVVNSSRRILYASSDEDFAAAAREECLSLCEAINTALRI